MYGRDFSVCSDDKKQNPRRHTVLDRTTMACLTIVKREQRSAGGNLVMFVYSWCVLNVELDLFPHGSSYTRSQFGLTVAVPAHVRPGHNCVCLHCIENTSGSAGKQKLTLVHRRSYAKLEGCYDDSVTYFAVICAVRAIRPNLKLYRNTRPNFLVRRSIIIAAVVAFFRRRRQHIICYGVPPLKNYKTANLNWNVSFRRFGLDLTIRYRYNRNVYCSVVKRLN